MGVKFVTICRISGKHACRLTFLGAHATISSPKSCSECVAQMRSVLHTNLGARWQEQQMAAKFIAVCQYFHPFTRISPLSGRHFRRFKLHWIHVTNAHHPAPAMWRELHGAANVSWHYVMPALTVLAPYRAYFLRSIRFRRSFDSFQGSASLKCGLDGQHAALPAATQAQQRPRPESIGKNVFF